MARDSTGGLPAAVPPPGREPGPGTSRPHRSGGEASSSDAGMEELHFRLDDMQRRLDEMRGASLNTGAAALQISALAALEQSLRATMGKIDDMIKEMRTPREREATVHLASGPVRITSRESH